MSLMRIAVLITLLAIPAAAPTQPAEKPNITKLAPKYRQLMDARDKLSPNSDHDRARSDFEQKLEEIRKTLAPAAEDWWSQHAERDLAAVTDYLLLALLPTHGASIGGALDHKHSAAVSEALKRPTFASIVQEWEWTSLDGVTDDHLERLWHDHLPHFTFNAARNRELMLLEIVRREKDRWQVFLKEQMALRQSEREKKGRLDLWRQLDSDLPLRTALRRLQKKPDPLAIELSRANHESTFPELPVLSLALVNVDGEDVGMQDGGDYRSGRLARWRFVVRHAAGKIMPSCEWFGMMGGGISTTRTLKPNESKKYELPLAHYIAPLQPGEYTLRVQFHNTEAIADKDDVSRLLLFGSKEVKLKIHPRVLKNAANRKAAEALIARLPDKGPTKIVEGTYGEWAHDFVPPDSPQGKLLTLGLDALPALVDAANDKQLHEARRATIFSILYSLTGTLNPRLQPGVLATSEGRSGPWTIAWGDGLGIGGIGKFTVYGEPANLKIDTAKQLDLAASWRTWSAGIKVEGEDKK